MKRLLVFCALLLGFLALPLHSADAQGAGLKGGLAWADLRGETGDPAVAYGRASGWAVGIFFSVGAGPAAMQPEVLYTRRVIDIQSGDAANTFGSFEITYVEVPVLFRTGSGTSAFYAGGYTAYRASAKAVNGSGEDRAEIDIADSVAELDYGLIAGVEIGLGGGLGIDARLSRGLKKIFKDQDGQTAPDLKHGGLSVLAFYRF